MVMLNWFVRDPTPVLSGARVILRAPRNRDYEAWRALRRESREFLKPFEPRWTEADLARKVFATRVKRAREEAEEGSDYSFFIFTHEGRREMLVGGITLSNVRRRAAQFTEHPQSAIALMKSIVNKTFETPFELIAAQGRAAQAISYTTDEHRASVEQFLKPKG